MTQKKLAGIGVTCNGVMSHPKERGGDVTCITELHTHHSCFKYDLENQSLLVLAW